MGTLLSPFNEALFQSTVSITSSGTWTAPAGVNVVYIEAVGGGTGGCGGQGCTKNTQLLTVTPGNAYSIVIGSGGTAGAVSGGGNFSGGSGGNGQLIIRY